MVVADFNVVGVAVLKPETDTPLVVDGDRVLASTVSSERMESVAEWDFEIFHSSRQSTKTKYKTPGGLPADRLKHLIHKHPFRQSPFKAGFVVDHNLGDRPDHKLLRHIREFGGFYGICRDHIVFDCKLVC